MSKQRVVVITGGGSGMGRAIARRFAEAGDKVYILGRDIKKLEQTAKDYSSIACIVCDVTDIDLIERARREITGKHKTIDVLVNNAGGTKSTASDMSPEEAAALWEGIIQTNLSSVFYMVNAFGEHIRHGGRIINISSLSAFAGSSLGSVSGLAYSAAKAGIHGLSRTLVKMYADKDITVNCVAPGLIDNTEFFGGKGIPDDRKERALPGIPLHRVGVPEDISAAVFYLASDEANFITGEILNVNGGSQFGR